MDTVLNQHGDDAESQMPVEATWTTEREALLATWGDHALCFTWLHAQAHAYYMVLNFAMTIPVLILTVLAGTTSIGISQLQEVCTETTRIINITMGCMSIVAAVLATLNNWMRVSETMEGHRVATRGWAAYRRCVLVTVGNRRDQRVRAGQVMLAARADYDRMSFASPSLPPTILRAFHVAFREATAVQRPDVVNGFQHTTVCEATPPRRATTPEGTPYDTSPPRTDVATITGDTPPTTIARLMSQQAEDLQQAERGLRMRQATLHRHGTPRSTAAIPRMRLAEDSTTMLPTTLTDVHVVGEEEEEEETQEKESRS